VNFFIQVSPSHANELEFARIVQLGLKSAGRHLPQMLQCDCATEADPGL